MSRAQSAARLPERDDKEAKGEYSPECGPQGHAGGRLRPCSGMVLAHFLHHEPAYPEATVGGEGRAAKRVALDQLHGMAWVCRVLGVLGLKH